MKALPNKDKEYHFCSFVTAIKGNAKRVKDAYGKTANKLRFSDGISFKKLIIAILTTAANLEKLGVVTIQSFPVVKRSVPIASLTMEQILGRFTYVQRALGSLLEASVIDRNPLLYGDLQEKNQSIAICEPIEVCEFLISFLQSFPNYGADEVLLDQLHQHLLARITV